MGITLGGRRTQQRGPHGATGSGSVPDASDLVDHKGEEEGGSRNEGVLWWPDRVGHFWDGPLCMRVCT